MCTGARVAKCCHWQARASVRFQQQDLSPVPGRKKSLHAIGHCRLQLNLELRAAGYKGAVSSVMALRAPSQHASCLSLLRLN